MGKDQELLEAARNGNVPVVEKILSQRAKRSGPLASLRRGPGANVQDASGYSALHHAALNGHKQIVQLLLTHEASTNIADVKGSSPLHLAAWSGNVDIVRLLLNHGPSVPNVNLTTKDNETALHCAAQYGHTAVVNELLEHCCDPTIRNARHESALDLAAQYGRLETVDLLVRTHPELVEPYMSRGSCTHPHTPLHLASRNGHKAVVETLLAAGMDVNAVSFGGTALHEAALCGKTEVARVLLQAGVDLRLRDQHHHTVQDLLRQFPPHTAPHAISNMISRHKAALSGGDMSDDELLRCDSSLPPIPVPSLGSPYENVRMPPGGPPSHSPTHWHRRVSASSAISIMSDNNNSGLSKSLMDSSYLSGNELSCPRNHRDLDQMSVSSTASSTGPSPSPSPRDIYLPMTPTGGSKISPTPPKKPPRRNLSVSPTHLTPLMSVSMDSGGGDIGEGRGGGGSVTGGAYEYLFMARSGVRSHGDLDELHAAAAMAAAGKQLRRGKSADQYVDMRLRRSVNIDDKELTAKTPDDPKYQPVAITSLYENVPFRTTNPRRKLRRIGHDRGYENCDPSIILSRGDLPFRKVDPLSPATASNNDQATFISNAYITLKSSTESLLNGDLRRSAMTNCPLSPTHYQQPPTPDHPPPSAMQAERSIHERIRPLSQEYSNIMKRRSRDIETETDEELLLLVFPSQNHHSSSATHCHNDVSSGSVSLSSSVSLSDKSVSTDNNAVEEFVGDAPFADKNYLASGKLRRYCTLPNRLMKGSVSESISSHATGKAERPKTLRGRLRNVFYDHKEDSTSSATSAAAVSSSVTSSSTSSAAALASSAGGGGGDKTLAILSPFDEQEEWAKISEIMASFGTGLVRESVFVTELEKEFQARLGLSRSESTVDSPISQSTTVNQWLTSLGLSDYESLFINYGYDNPDFINGVLDDSDLKDMGIGNDKDRKTILDASRSLPCKVRDAFVSVALNNNNNHVIKDGGGGERPPESGDGNSSTTTNNSQTTAEGNDVDEWLGKLQLEEYCETFRRHLYTEMEKVSRIWEVELTAVLEIEKAGHRKRILASLPQTKERCPNLPAGFPKQTAAPNIEDINADLSQLKNNIQQLKEEIRVKLPQQQSASNSGTGQQSNTGTLRHSHKKSRPAPPPPPGGSPPPSAASDLEIRAPSELLVGVPATLTAQWRHRPHALLAGHITYTALYLGSTLVRDMRGTESTKKSIQKLKKSTSGNEEKSIPEIILAISYRGVKFHTSNQELICEHEIRNIHCACQDAEDLTHFAYITKDHASKSHFCHVFCVQTMDQATEVILTLGQAFEVAYQMALRENLASNRSQLSKQSAGNTSNGHTRSRSVNQIVSQNSPGTVTSSSPQTNHSRSHSVNEIKVNGASTNSSPQKYQEGGGHPSTPSSVVGTPGRAPIVMSEDI
ncbi:LOW QUALITY PROTEIN: ankyrin repeat and SAM domain-containing protein 1A [Nilaparvata lugens]|uniref:LOW QUALITY PROTEIN: ankyrin repeat and SAM domain-containing protein 1A n=1 Tax=Nilaparvata lugens TaxID=108931 RepID=UPI00193E0425|nr:LOW QUALITY PROTEIN: ankyrin repeat and SAM domain-containing protein 1A [Nilaparvata lugens]